MSKRVFFCIFASFLLSTAALRPDETAPVSLIYMATASYLHYGGDLWTASTSGGTATRLTAHPGVETYAKFSPDGNWIAFTGQYDGDEQVYVMPSGGGEPKQLTFYPSRGPLAPRWGFDNQVMAGRRTDEIYFRSLRDSWTLARSPRSIPSRRPAARLSRCRCPRQVRVTFRPTGRRWSTRRVFAIFGPKSDTAADRRTSFTSTISRRTTRR